jgi:hypothetical protein
MLPAIESAESVYVGHEFVIPRKSSEHLYLQAFLWTVYANAIILREFLQQMDSLMD